MVKSNRKIPAKISKWKIISIILVLLAVALIGKLVYDHERPALPESWSTAHIENPDTGHFSEIKNQQMPAPVAAEPAPTPAKIEPPLTPCQKTAAAIGAFYQHLAGQEYIKAYDLHEPVGDHIKKIVIKLLNNPPVVVAENNDFFSLLKNAAHFYRVLGPKDLSFVRDIINYENDDIEGLMATFYKASQVDCRANISLQLPLGKLYEYASFFSSTLGGQSYLFRRDSKLRILTRYYCVLIMERAAEQNKNKYDIDIKSFAKSVIKDMQETNALDNTEQYISTLRDIQAKPPNHGSSATSLHSR